MPYPRPDPEWTGPFAEMPVLPEISGWTVRRLSLARKAAKVRCRACGREAVITANGWPVLFRRRMDQTVDEIAPTLKCETCGAHEAQVCGFAMEQDDRRPFFVRREHAGVALRRGG